MKMRACAVLIIFLLLQLSEGVLAQGYSESGSGDRVHRDFAGKPCLASTGVVHPLTSNPHIMNHAVSLNNHCSERITVKVCYYNTEECTVVDVPSNSQKEQVIGVFPAMQVFRFQVKERF